MMKTKFAFLVLLNVLIVSCTPTTRTQEDVVVEIATEEVATEESAVTEEPSETPIACVTLLAPVNDVEIPPVGKVTFSWTPMDEAGKYVLNIILPTGDVVPFETDQTFRDQYMEAFVFGGDYQWEVVAQDANGSEICISEESTFEKAAYENPNSSNNGGDGSGAGNTGESNNGTGNTDESNSGTGNTGEANSGTGNTGEFNNGTGNTGEFNNGTGNTGEFNNGTGNTGEFNNGTGNTGEFNNGTGNTGEFNNGTGNTGESNSGTGNTGEFNNGTGNTGEYNSGTGNTGEFNNGTENTGEYNSGAGGLSDGGSEIVVGAGGDIALIVLGWWYWRKWRRR